MSTGQKHLVKCRCILSQFKNLPDPPTHQFIVFSTIDDDNTVKVKFSQCNNCGVVHKVTDICTSEIIHGKEALNSVVTIDDIKLSLPGNLANLLEVNKADLPTWEAVSFLLENKKWGEFVIISTDTTEDMKQGKYVRILGETFFKVEQFSREEYARLK